MPYVICDHCDTVHIRADIPRGCKAYCHCCEHPLYSNQTSNIDAMLAVSLTALIVFVIANVFPIVRVELAGEQSLPTLWAAIVAGYESGYALMAAMAAAMVILFPLALISLSLYVFLPVRFGFELPGITTAMHLWHLVRPWAMVEVFMIGVLVSVVKLSGSAIVTPAAGLWGFAALTVLMALLGSFNTREIWEIRESAQS